MVDLSDINDPEFIAAYNLCKPASMTSMERMYALYGAVRYIAAAGVPGAFVECGVWKGGSVMMMACALLGMGVNDRDIVMFDTFDTIPVPGPEDIDHEGVHASTMLRRLQKSAVPQAQWNPAPVDAVLAKSQAHRLRYGSVHRAARRRTENHPRRRAGNHRLAAPRHRLVQIDRHELEHLFPRLSRKGVLIVDDYGHFKGARKAIDAYFAAQPTPYLLNRIDYTARMLIKA